MAMHPARLQVPASTLTLVETGHGLRRVTTLIDQHLAFEGVRAVSGGRPLDLNWQNAETAPLRIALESTPFLRAELVIVDSRGRRQASLPVDFDRRVQNASAVSLLGSGSNGALQVSLKAPLPVSGARIGLRFTPRSDSTPLDLHKVVHWLEALAPRRLLGLWMRDGARWGTEPIPIPTDYPRVPKDYARAVRVLARIQQRSGRAFAMPMEIDEEAAEAIGLTDALLRGKTVVGRWKDVSIQQDPELIGFLNDSKHGVMLEFRTSHILRIGTQEVEIGEVEYRLLQVLNYEHDEEKQLIRLTPGTENRFHVRLVAVAEKFREDGATNWVPAAMLEPYAGRWIAQSGTQVLIAAEGFAEAAMKVRASGRLATIWRVPASVDEAEALPSLGR